VDLLFAGYKRPRLCSEYDRQAREALEVHLRHASIRLGYSQFTIQVNKHEKYNDFDFFFDKNGASQAGTTVNVILE
jgi:hypothetical protein